MTTFQNDQHRRFQEHDELLHEVAEQLGEGWSVKVQDPDYPTNPTVQHVDGRRIFFSTGWPNKDKFGLHAAYPDGTHDAVRLPNHGINVSKTKTGVQIAKDIQRRLLPGYDADFKVAVEKVDQAAVDLAAQQVVVKQFAEAFGDSYFSPEEAKHSGNPKTNVRWYRLNHDGYGDVEVNFNGTTAAFNLRSIPLAVAEKIVALLAAEGGAEA